MVRAIPSFDSSLEALHPLQASEWHFGLNGGLKPSDVTPGSNAKVWWKCGGCGVEWQAIIANRTAKNSQGCRSCAMKARRKVQPAKSLMVCRPDLAAQLHSTFNGDLSADAIGSGSHKKVWWLCPTCGNEFEMTPKARTGPTASGCPPCAYRRIGENQATPREGESLAERSPEVAASWHPSRNLPATPSTIKNASGLRAWWKCLNADCGHEWQTSVANRTGGKRTGCPICSRAQRRAVYARTHIALPGASFGDLHPALLGEWNITRNGKLDPFALKPASSTKAWWTCRDCGHEWQTTIGLRTTAGTGCAPCSYKQRGVKRQTPVAGASIAELFPDLLQEWDWERNADLDPSQLKPGSDLKVWWVCARKGHKWLAHIYHRASRKPTGCFQCAHVPEVGESFAELNPMTAREWHPTRNAEVRPDEVKPSSAYEAWWKCSARGHEWQTPVFNRSGSRITSCPTCTMWGTSAAQIRIAHELIAAGIPIVLDHPKVPVTGRRPVAADMVIPDHQLIIEYDGSHHHARPGSLDRDRNQSRLLEAAGWTVLRVRPEAIDPIDEYSIRVSNGASVKQICVLTLRRIRDLGYPVERLPEYEADSELWAAAESDAAVLNLKSRSLLREFPRIAAEWHPTRNGMQKPEDINPGSKIPAWWLCKKCGHEWRVRPGHRTTGGTGCPNCAAIGRANKVRTPKPGKSLAEVYPDLIKILHPDRNGDLDLYQINAGAKLLVWWLCPDCGHAWSTENPRNAACRPCGIKRMALTRTTPAPGESLSDLYPLIASEWHPTKNGELLPSHVRETHTGAVWWLCSECGREWKVGPRNRISGGAGCRRCAARAVGRQRRTPGAGESLAEMYPTLAAEWDAPRNQELTPHDVKPDTIKQVWWNCSKCGHEWKARIRCRTVEGHGCKKCASAHLSVTRRMPKPGNSLADVRPELLALWHPTLNAEIAPTEMTPSSHTKVWWLCPDCGREWQGVCCTSR